MFYRFRDCELDDSLYQLRRSGKPISIEPKVFDVLAYLLHHRDRVVSKDELLEKLWSGQVVSETALTRCIVAARKAVGDNGARQEVIETQHGRGYRFVAPLTTPPVVSTQHAVVSSQAEASQKANGKNQKVKMEDGTEEITQRSPAVYNLSQDSTLSTQDLLLPAPVRSWSTRSFLLGGLLLLAGLIIAVQYLSRPSLSTQDSTLGTQQAPQALPLPDKPSIVVLPFINMSEDPKQEYFSDFITEDLTNDLSRISGLFVIARNSAFTYKGKVVKVQEVSKELGVRYILEGSVRRAGDRVRVTAQLIDGTTGGHIWSERYDLPFTDIFAVQDEVVQKIVTTLKLQLTLWEQGALVRKRTDNLEAYDYHLRGIGYAYRLTKEANVQARQMFERAIELDPQYAAAYASAGWTYMFDLLFQWSQDPRAFEQAAAMAQRAVTLDDSLPMAHTALAQIYLWKRQHAEAIAEAERAVAVAPNSAEGAVMLANVLSMANRPEKAIGIIEKAMRLNPCYPFFYLGALGEAYRLARQYDKAIPILKNTLTRNPNWLPAHADLAIAYSELDQEAEAKAEVTAILRISPNYPLQLAKQTWPVKDPAVLERDLAALRKAGLK
jgi:TolB-like protein/DNA-binding winged helix-turn-helix (wHTH) protein/cytochrome c-type biogenesis protein CcmH/NrfG